MSTEAAVNGKTSSKKTKTLKEVLKVAGKAVKKLQSKKKTPKIEKFDVIEVVSEKKLTPKQRKEALEAIASKHDERNHIVSITMLQLSQVSESSEEFSVPYAFAGGQRPNTAHHDKIVRVALFEAPAAWVHALAKRRDLSAQAKATIKAFLSIDPLKQLDQLVRTPTQFRRALGSMLTKKDPMLEVEINGQWYPVPILVQSGSFFFSSYTCIEFVLILEDKVYENRMYVEDRHFLSQTGQPISRTVRDVLLELGIKPTSPENVKIFKDKLRRADELSQKHGLVVDVETSVAVFKKIGWWEVMQPTPLGTKDSPRTLIVEKNLERVDAAGHHHDQGYKLPMVRTFSPDLKKFCYVDVDDLKTHSFDEKAKDRIVLPKEMKSVLDQVFDTAPGKIFGDLFRNRHGGLIVLASGGPGVGKTLTAEVYSEFTKRPLYIMEMGELGTNLQSVEGNLQKIFDRAQRWNAVLLFDEADIFLAKRTDSDLDRSAIVGVFLRLLDRYDGCLFLTTNRPEVIDHAFKSRISLALRYPDLEQGRRRKVFDQMLEAAGVRIDGDMSEIYEYELNGRNIRNVIRILKMLGKDSSVLTVEDVKEALQYIAR